MKKVAVLIDAGFLQKLYYEKTKKNIQANQIILLSHKLLKQENEELFRIYYYDAPPFGEELINPIDNSKRNFADTDLYKAVNSFHIELAEKEFVALRKGKLSFSGWKLTRQAIQKIREGKFQSISPTDITPDFKQKAVDMKIGLDIAWLSTKRIVDKIILVTADNDFVPVMKFARKEGIHIAVAKIEKLTSDMKQHSDEIIELSLNDLTHNQK